MRVIIVGPAQSGKTTMLHRVIRSNTNTTFSLIIDGYEAFAAPITPNIPVGMNFIITTTN
jgi:GTPase SAR1 family protein